MKKEERGVVINDTAPLSFCDGYGKEGDWMTNAEGVIWLKAWKRERVPKYNLYFPRRTLKNGISSGIEAVWQNCLIDELIERVRNSEFDPVTEVAMYYYEMDEVLAMSDDDHFITHRFAGYMSEQAHAILSYLQKIEKERHQDPEARDYQKVIFRHELQKALDERDIYVTGGPDSFLG